MDKEEMLKALAPCGLNCLKCFAYKDGMIANAASDLKNLLGNFKIYAERFKEFHQDLDSYPIFEKVLTFLSKGSCLGCRNGECLNGGCKAQSCADSGKVEFCADCEDFPCNDHHLPKTLEKPWLIINRHLQKVGLEAFFEESMKKDRYPF